MPPSRPINTLEGQRGERYENKASRHQREALRDPTGRTSQLRGDYEPRRKRRKTSDPYGEDELMTDPLRHSREGHGITTDAARYASYATISKSIHDQIPTREMRKVEIAMKTRGYARWKSKGLTLQSASPSREPRSRQTAGTRNLIPKDTASYVNSYDEAPVVDKNQHHPEQRSESPKKSSSPDALGAVDLSRLSSDSSSFGSTRPIAKNILLQPGGNEIAGMRTQSMLLEPAKPKQSKAHLRLPSSAKTTRSLNGNFVFIADYIAARGCRAHEKNAIKLVVDDNDGSLVVESNDKVFDGQQIPIHLSQNVLYCNSDCTISLGLPLDPSHRGGQDNKVDIIFNSEEALKRFCNLLRNLGIENQSDVQGDRMQRILKKHTAMQDEERRRQNSRTQHFDPELELYEANQTKRRKATTASDHEMPRSKRPRRTLVSTLQKAEQTLTEHNLPQRPHTNRVAQEGGVFNSSADQNRSQLADNSIASVKSENRSALRHGKRTRSSIGKLALDIPSPPKYSEEFGLGKEWKHPLVYPSTGKPRVTVEFHDLLRLDDDECLNDNLVEFALRMMALNLEAKQPEIAKKIYWFNTYFFETLNKNVRGRNEINFDSVRRWTKSVDIFSYDYVVIPINEDFHWYVVLICNLPALSNPKSASEKLLEVDTLDASQPKFNDMTPYLPSVTSKTVHKPPDEPSTRQSFSEMNLQDNGLAPSSNSLENYLPKSKVATENDVVHTTNESVEPIGVAEQDHELQYTRLPESLANEEESVLTVSLEHNSGEEQSANSKRKLSSVRKKRAPPPLRKFDPSEPTIITLDSLGAPHQPAIRALKTYLLREAEDKKKRAFFEDTQLKGMTAKGIPQQQNFTDCGLYLLQYMQRFCENPLDFVTSILQKRLDSRNDWLAFDPGSMRVKLRDTIFNLHHEQEASRNKTRAQGKLTNGKDLAESKSEIEKKETTQRATSDNALKEQASKPSNGTQANLLISKDPPLSLPLSINCYEPENQHERSEGIQVYNQVSEQLNTELEANALQSDLKEKPKKATEFIQVPDSQQDIKEGNTEAHLREMHSSGPEVFQLSTILQDEANECVPATETEGEAKEDRRSGSLANNMEKKCIDLGESGDRVVEVVAVDDT